MTYPSQDKADTPKNKEKAQNNKREFKPPKKITDRYLHNSGLAYLQRFPASSAHFKSVMMRKIDKSCRHHTEQNRDDCEVLLNALTVKFQDMGLLDDTAYLQGMVTSLRRRGLAARQIEMKLMQKGLDKEDIINTIRQYDSDELDDEYNGDFHAALIFARKKRLGPYDKTQRHTPEKSFASLARAGYSYDIAKKVIEMSDDELEEIMKHSRVR